MLLAAFELYLKVKTMKIIKNYDEILKTAINEYVEEKSESDVYCDDEFRTSDKFEKKISNLINKRR